MNTMKIAVVLFGILNLWLCYGAVELNRPSYENRSYHSKGIDGLIDQLLPLFKDPDLANLFFNCFPNTLDTTVSYFGQDVDQSGNDSFIITGDIDALWLRDSANQVIPYLPYAAMDEDIQYLVEGLIARHSRSILIDPFANSFNFNQSGKGHQNDIRTPPMSRGVFEGKYEIDSLAAFLKLSYWYYRVMGTKNLSRVMTKTWIAAVESLLKTVKSMQSSTGMESNPPYKFQRLTTQATDTLMMSGRGPPAKPFGLTRSLFRPSDDAVTHSYNIPGNAMICVELKHLNEILEHSDDVIFDTKSLASEASSIASEICGALEKLQDVMKERHFSIPYEVDGLDSSALFMDDANIPSILSLPVLGYMDRSDSLYRQSRAFLLSTNNPFWFSGSAGSGIGGPHVGPNYAWPMAIIVQAMTSIDDSEVSTCLETLIRSSAGTGFMHESFNINNVNDYTRKWFAWANGLFGELILQLIVERPELIVKPESIVLAQSLVQVPISLQAERDVALLKSIPF